MSSEQKQQQRPAEPSLKALSSAAQSYLIELTSSEKSQSGWTQTTVDNEIANRCATEVVQYVTERLTSQKRSELLQLIQFDTKREAETRMENR
jgi:hypothetical protein